MMELKKLQCYARNNFLIATVGTSFYCATTCADLALKAPILSEEEIKVEIEAPQTISSRSPKLQYDNYFQVTGGVPITEQNIDISTSIAQVQVPFASSGTFLLDWVGGVGTINTSVETAALTETGLGLATRRMAGFRFRIDGRVRYLDEHVFDEGIATKDFGGPVQFVSSLGADWMLTKDSLVLGYRLEHMSNYDIYDSNPALNSHNLIMSFSF